MGSRHRWVYMTATNREEARTIGRKVLEGRLAACVNIIQGMESMYWWEGRIEEGAEVVIVAKTTAEKVPDLIRTVKGVHSYKCPCVVTLPIQEGNPDYLKWLSAETAASDI